MKKWLIALLFGGFITAASANETITIGASSIPHAEMLRFIKPTLAKEGYDLKITEFSDYVTPNIAVIQKQLDANFTQSKPFFVQFNKDHHSSLVDLVDVHIEPMGVYSSPSEKVFNQSTKATNLIKDTKIGVPSDPTNEGRALSILEANGILKIKPGVPLPTKRDLIANPYNVDIVELDPAMLPRSLKAGQVNLAVINSNIAMQAGLNPSKDAVLVESKSSPFANLVAVRAEEVNEPKLKALAKALTSPQMKQFILTKYAGAVVPAF